MSGQAAEARRILDATARPAAELTRAELVADRAKLRAVAEMLLLRVSDADTAVMDRYGAYMAEPMGPKP